MKVKILRDETPFRAGEIYDLPDAEAKKLLRQGVAKPADRKESRRARSK